MFIQNQIENYIIYKERTIKEALDKIDLNKLGFLIVVNKQLKVQGLVTDGDFRRSILNGIQLKERVEKISNRAFIFLDKDYTQDDVEKIFSGSVVQHIPVLENGKLLDIVTDEKNFGIKKNCTKQVGENVKRGWRVS